jgi:hypothetical protein
MATNFILTLDTTAPAGVVALLNNGDAATGSVNVNLHTTTTDADTTGYQMKVWGDVVGAPDEASAAWVAYAVDAAVTLTDGDGGKTVNVRLRDDVGNQSAVASDTIVLDTTAPTPNITVDADRTKISKVAGWDVSTFSFAVDQDVAQWDVRVVPAANSPHSAGVSLHSGGALAAGVNQQVQITGAELDAASPGDGAKVIKVFAVDPNGNWSA